jgi:AcrR family transcriptional regulator
VKTREPSAAQAETRRRLLEAAGELFAEKGFRLAGTREICRRAGTDIAAIHYHFGSKEALYEQVLHYADGLLVDSLPQFDGPGPREARLAAMIEWVLTQTFAQGQSEWRWKFVEQAATEVTDSLQAFIDSKILPVFQALDAICKEFLGPQATQQQVRFATRSILGQCFYYRHFRVLISGSGEKFSKEEIRQLRDHIVEFSIGGLMARARHIGKAQRNGRGSSSVAPRQRQKLRARTATP